MFAVYDAVRLAEFESRSAQPSSPVRVSRPSLLSAWSARARLVVSGDLHRLADALSPVGEPRLSGER